MRVTVPLDDELYAAATMEAAASGVTTAEYIASVLRQHLSHQKDPGSQPRFTVHTFAGGKTLPGVPIDLTCYGELLDYMDAHDEKFHALYPNNRLREAFGISVEDGGPNEDANAGYIYLEGHR